MVHADSRLSPAVVAEVLATARDPDMRWGRLDVHLDGPGWPFRVIERSMNLRSRLTGICTGDQGIFVRRGVLDAVGGVPLQALMEDIELCKRLRRLGRPRWLRGPITTSARRWQHDGTLRTVLRMWSYRLRYFFGASPDLLAKRYYGADG